MDKKYLFIGTLDSLVIAPPFFEDDPSTGLFSDGLDVVRAAFETTEELKVFLAAGSNFAQPRTHYTKLIAGMMTAYPGSILYIVDGYPEPLVKSALKDVGKVVHNMSNVLGDETGPKVFCVKQTNKEDTGITDFKDMVVKAKASRTLVSREPVPQLLYAPVEDSAVMWKRFDEAETYGKARGYTVKNFHKEKLETLFPEINTYITRTIERMQQEQLKRMGLAGAPKAQPTIEPPTLGNA